MAVNQREFLSSFTALELEVAQILLDLPELIASSVWKPKFSWGGKRRRSCLDFPPLVSRAPVRAAIEETIPRIAEAEKNEDERPAVSPDTPFNFTPSESDGVKSVSQLEATKRTPKKRSRKEYTDSVEGLTRSRDLLRGELENVKKYYKKLKAFHSQLEAIKFVVLNSTTTSPRKEAESSPRQQTQPQPFDGYPPHPTVQNQHVPSSSDKGIGPGHGRVPLLFDLNQPAEEEVFCSVPSLFQSQPLVISPVAYERARCAEARRMRRGIIKTKMSRSCPTVKGQKD